MSTIPIGPPATAPNDPTQTSAYSGSTAAEITETEAVVATRDASDTTNTGGNDTQSQTGSSAGTGVPAQPVGPATPEGRAVEAALTSDADQMTVVQEQAMLEKISGVASSDTAVEDLKRAALGDATDIADPAIRTTPEPEETDRTERSERTEAAVQETRDINLPAAVKSYSRVA